MPVQIKDHTGHRGLNSGDLVMAANGELHHVSKGDEGRTTWLERWSDEYGITLTDEGVGSYADERLFPLTVVHVTVPAGVPLSDDERRYLAMHARYESNRQDDVRYWDADPGERARLKQRWREIADWLHPDPWGEQSPQQTFRLGGVEDGHVMVWTGGFTKPVRVLRDSDGEMPLVECPDCDSPATVGHEGNVRCTAVSGCAPVWRVLVVRIPES
jgi:hypothetical protein